MVNAGNILTVDKLTKHFKDFSLKNVSFQLPRGYVMGIVLAKYLSVFPYAAVAILSFLFAQEVVFVTGIPVLGGTPISKISLEGLAGALIAMVTFISFYYPIYFKLGYARIKWAGMVIVLCLMVFIPMTGSILTGEFGVVNNPILLNIIAILGRLSNWQHAQADWQIASYMLVCALILMAASVSLSLRFCCRREF